MLLNTWKLIRRAVENFVFYSFCFVKSFEIKVGQRQELDIYLLSKYVDVKELLVK